MFFLYTLVCSVFFTLCLCKFEPIKTFFDCIFVTFSFFAKFYTYYLSLLFIFSLYTFVCSLFTLCFCLYLFSLYFCLFFFYSLGFLLFVLVRLNLLKLSLIVFLSPFHSCIILPFNTFCRIYNFLNLLGQIL